MIRKLFCQDADLSDDKSTQNELYPQDSIPKVSVIKKLRTFVKSLFAKECDADSVGKIEI